MKILITGAGGMLGQDVRMAAAEAGIEVAAQTRAELDITDAGSVASAIAVHAPELVINCAAWTDVDGAEATPAAAHQVNGEGAGNVAHAAQACGAHTVHISSDYVFDGAKRRPYVESDPTGPLSQYGASKLAGEDAVAANAPASHTIVRSSWLFGSGGPCFPKTMLRLAAERDHLGVVDDQTGCPTFTGHLAPALIDLARAPGGPPNGIVHLAAGGTCTWYELAARTIELAGLDCEVRPITTAEMPRPATRPAYSVLGTERGGQIPRLPAWQDGLRQFLDLGVRT